MAEKSGDAQDSLASCLSANVDIPVLMLGESGPGAKGKCGAADSRNASSPRAHRTFLKVNCAAAPGDLLESELFGHEAGAVTGATHAKPGSLRIPVAVGTILVDEIGEMPPVQAKLLHVLQDETFSAWAAAR